MFLLVIGLTFASQIGRFLYLPNIKDNFIKMKILCTNLLQNGKINFMQAYSKVPRRVIFSVIQYEKYTGRLVPARGYHEI